MSQNSGTVSARVLARTFALCRRGGYDVQALCRAAGLHESVLTDSEVRVPYALVAALSEHVLTLTGDENFGLHLAAAGTGDGTAELDAGMLFLMASPSVRSALERMVEHQRYWGDGRRMTLHAHEGGLVVRYALAGASGVYARHCDECMMAELTLGLRALTGAPIRARQVCFRHAAPAHTAEHEELFGCPLEFSAPHTQTVLEDATLDLPLQHAHAAFCEIFGQQVQRALARLPETASTSVEVRAAIQAALASGQCNLDKTARSLGLSVRTLQRRLQDEGTSFAALVEALRRELAATYLARGLHATEVATLLGYADVTAFHHAARRWREARADD